MRVTYVILVLTVGFSLGCFNNRSLFTSLQFNAWQIKHRGEYWRFISHALVHGDWIHLLFNMFALFMFGKVVEDYFQYYFKEKGIFYFVLLYVGGVLFASVPSFEKHKNHEWFNSVGASGAISAVIFSYILLEPLNPLCLYGLLCFPGIVWGIVYLVYSWYASKNQSDIINHDAHFGGAIFGILFTLALKPAIGLTFMNKILDYFG